MKFYIKQFYSNIADALKYAVSDWQSILLIAVVLLIATVIEEEIEHAQNELFFVLFILLLIFLFIEEGYGAKIVHETFNGSTKPPKLNNLKELMKEGFNDMIVSFTYILVFILFLGLSFGAYWVGNDRLILALIFFILAILTYTFLHGALINMAKRQTLKAGFNLKEIFNLFRNLGLINTLILTICGFIAQFLIISCVLDIGALDIMKILDFIITFILAPISVTFMKRLFGLYGRQSDYQ